MIRRCLGLFLVAFCLVGVPFRSPAPLIYRPGEGWTYEPVGGEGKWRLTRAKDQMEAAQAAFDKKASKLALKSDEQKVARSAAIQRAMKQAIDTPLDVMRGCAQAGGHGETVARHGNPSASSDVQVGLEVLGAGLRGARLNVEINLGSVKDAAYVVDVTGEVEVLAGALDAAVARARRVLA